VSKARLFTQPPEFARGSERLATNRDPSESITAPEAMSVDGLESGVAPRLGHDDADVAVTAGA
jgi:hypothetical protein